MLFWVVISLACLVSIAILLRALTRGRGDAVPSAAYDMQVYRDQLGEVERDLARGVIEISEAERLRNEVSRRILAADTVLAEETWNRTDRRGKNRILVPVMALAIPGASLGLYAQFGAPGYSDQGLADRLEHARESYENRPSQAQAERAMPPGLPEPDISEAYKNLIERLRNTVAGRPDDIEGHRLLAHEEARLGNHKAAYTAQEAVLRLSGTDISADDFVLMATMMVLAAGGYVSPETEATLRKALALDPQNPLARYYIGLVWSQNGRPDRAFSVWRRLLDEGPNHAPWVIDIAHRIEDTAFRAGVRYSLPRAVSPSQPGPSTEDIEAVSSLSPGERMEMINSMVQGLSDRLATEGGPPEDWARLINALGVLGEANQARRIHMEALTVFADSAAALDMINSAAQRAGILE